MNINKKIPASVISGICAFGIMFAAVSAPVQAQTLNPKDNAPATYTLLEPLPCLDTGSSANCTPGTQITQIQFKDYVQYAFNLLIAMAGVAAVFMIVWGGFQYMSSDAYSGKKEGLTRFQNAIYGLLLVLCSYLILKTIDPRLVEIPTTLVKPLDITYKPNEIAGFFQQLQDDANRYRSQNMEIIKNVSAAKKEYDRLEAERKILCDQLAVEFGYGQEPGITCEELILKSGSRDLDVQDIARRAQDLGNQQNDLATKMVVDVAIGKMNAVMQKCYGVSSDASKVKVLGFTFYNAESGTYEQVDCSEEINEAMKDALEDMSLINSNEQKVVAEKIEDYRRYSETMTKINSVVKQNMSSSPGVTALVDTLQSSVTVAATAVGAIYGGAAGGVIGFTGAQVFNGVVIGAPIQNAHSADAQRTRDFIQKEFDGNVSLICDPKIKEQYKAQASALMTKLGGKLNLSNSGWISSCGT